MVRLFILRKIDSQNNTIKFQTLNNIESYELHMKIDTHLIDSQNS